MLETIFFIALAGVYAVLKMVLEKRLAPLDAASDESRLSDLAFACGISEYEIFQVAGDRWNFSRGKIDHDFKGYLKEGIVPRYVSEYTRTHLLGGDRTYQQLLYSGGRPPYL